MASEGEVRGTFTAECRRASRGRGGQVGTIISRELQRCEKCLSEWENVGCIRRETRHTAEGNLARKGLRGCADDGDHERLVTSEVVYEGI